MTRKTAPLGAELKRIESDCSDQRFRLEYAASLLRLLAETMSENHNGAGDEDGAAWRSAGYLAEQIATHTEGLGESLEELDRLSMRAERRDDRPEPATASGLRVVSTHDDGAAS
jgi:hypothetical protein